MNLITKSQYKTYDKLSRYSRIPIFYNKEDDRWFGGKVKWLKDTTVYILHTVEATDNLDSLSLKYYGNPIYYWIIADFNRILDPFKDLKVGDTIKIPTFSAIEWKN